MGWREGVGESPIPQTDGGGTFFVEEESSRGEENKTNESDADSLVALAMCIHDVIIKDPYSRPDCNKCRKNYYKIRKKPCSHFEQTEDCFICGINLNGWIYESS